MHRESRNSQISQDSSAVKVSSHCMGAEIFLCSNEGGHNLAIMKISQPRQIKKGTNQLMRDFIARLLVCLYRVVKIISIKCNSVSLQEFMPLRQARFHTAPLRSREEKALNSFKKNHTIHTHSSSQRHTTTNRSLLPVVSS